MSGLRRDAARPLRQLEKCTVGVPIRVRGDSPLSQRPTRGPTLIRAQRTASPSERGIVRYALEVHFAGRPAEAPQGRRAFDATGPRTTLG